MHSIFCVTHQSNITIDLDDAASIVWLGAAGQAPKTARKVIDVNQEYPDLMAWHSFLTGSAGSFAIRRFLINQRRGFSDFELITLTQYRKFVSRRQFGISSVSYPTLRIVNEKQNVPTFESWFSEPDKYFCIATPVEVGSALIQYGNVHQAPDFLRYIAIAVELEFITAEECLELFNSSLHIPGGIEFGTYPVNIYLTLVEQLEAVCLQFLERHRPLKLDAYQRRALSFCNERLGSYLLQKILREIFGSLIPSDIVGYMHSIDIGFEDYRIGN